MAAEEIRRLSNEGQYEALSKYVKEHSDAVLKLERAQRESLLTLECCQHSLAWLAALYCEVENASTAQEIQWDTLLEHMRTFASNFTSDQVKLLGRPFCQLFHRFTDMMCVHRKAMQGIAVLRSAVQRYGPSPTTLTSIHSDLVQLCLAARCVKPCLPFLNVNYTSVLSDHGQMDSQYIVQFFYYGGMVFTCIHDYLKALQLFTMCLCVPAVAISAVMIAAYKKFILVSLLKYGKVISLPRCAGQFVERLFKGSCGPYIELGRAYTAHNSVGVKEIIRNRMETFVTDGNYGLIKRLESQLVQHAVQRLTLSFMTLPLSDAAVRVELPSAADMEKQLREMIECGEVMAQISHRDQMVVFGDCQSTMDRHRQIQLEEQLNECMKLQERLGKANEQLALDPRYVQKSISGGAPEDDPLTEDHLM